MLLRKFRENGPDVLFLIFVLMVFTWMGAFLHPVMPSAEGSDDMPMPLFKILLGITGFSPFISIFSAFLIMLLMAFLVVNFNTNAFFISERTFLPALVYVVITGMNPQYQLMNPALPAAPFLILAIRKIMDSYKVQGTAYSFYDAGILIATGSLFYAGMIWFGILLIVAILVIRPFSIREIVISLAGLLTPLFIFTGFYYVLGYDMDYLRSAVNYNLFAGEAVTHLPLLNIIVLLIAGAVVLVSVSHLLGALKEKRIKSRKTFTLLFWTFFISAGTFVAFKPVSLEIFWIASIPLTYFLCHYFVFSRKKKITGMLFTLLLILVIVIQAVNLAG
jgi:hypothetical protein